MIKREAKFQNRFNQWCRERKFPTSVFELKYAPANRMSFDDVREHQINGLLCVKKGTLAYKISDETRSYKPFDSFCFTKAPAYVVICFGGENIFHGIDIEKFIEEKETSPIRSLTEERAREIASFSDTI